MDQNTLEQMNAFYKIARDSTDSTAKQKARSDFFSMCWYQWEAMYTAMKEQSVGN